MSNIVFQSGITSFSVPYISLISGGLQAGKAILIEGAIPVQCSGFVISLNCGQYERDDVALQIKPEFGSRSLVLNSRQNGSWGREEKLSLSLQKGNSFDLVIAVHAENYQIIWNRCEIGRFKHRIPLERVTVLDIGGHVSLTNVVVITSWAGSYPHGQGGTITTFDQGQSDINPPQIIECQLGPTTQKTTLLNLSTGQPYFEFSILNPVQNPNLPYTSPIGALRPGMALFLRGIVDCNADRFEVNFKTGQSDKDDIAFHFNPRLKGPVVMNSLRNGKWDTEEYTSNNPFKMGETFQMFIVIRTEGYEVYINEKQNYIFKHRIPLDKVTTLNTNGHMNVKILGFIENWSTFPQFTTTPTTGNVDPSSKREFLLQIPNLTVPNTPGRLNPGMAFYFKGVAGTETDRFAINFKTGRNNKDDIALYFSPRYNAKVVMNSFRNGAWDVEEHGPDNPFRVGEDFEIIFVFQSEGYQVYVNGKAHYLFKHRIPMEKVSIISITGDIMVTDVEFIKNWSTSPFAAKIHKTPTSTVYSKWSPSTIQSELTQTVHNPDIPYVSPIQGGLRVGMALYLHGVVGTKLDQFAVNFRTGQPGHDEIAFHFNPRSKAKVVLNNWRGSAWEPTSEHCHENPFSIAEAFEAIFVITHYGYQVYVNGKDQCLYKHRIPVERVKTVHVTGDVVVNVLGFILNWNRVGFFRWGLSAIQSDFLYPVRNPSLPYVGPVPERLKAGQALYFHGIADTTGDGFAINLKTGQASNDDIAFHFNPRYNANVVMNSFRNGGWEAQEYTTDNPIKMGEIVEVFIAIKSEGYQVFLKDKVYYVFKHRIPVENVRAVNISGNVAVNLFAFIQNWRTSYFGRQLGGFDRWFPSVIESELSSPVRNPALPYTIPIYGGLNIGMAFYLKGVVGTKCDQFTIKFKTGQTEQHEIAFNYNPQMHAKVGMNSWRGGAWEANTERGAENPFRKGETFEMIIAIKSEGFQVFVNGYEPYIFKHRIAMNYVNVLNISGDIFVKLCGFIQNWGKCLTAIEAMKNLSLD